MPPHSRPNHTNQQLLKQHPRRPQGTCVLDDDAAYVDDANRLRDGSVNANVEVWVLMRRRKLPGRHGVGGGELYHGHGMEMTEAVMEDLLVVQKDVRTSKSGDQASSIESSLDEKAFMTIVLDLNGLLLKQCTQESLAFPCIEYFSNRH